MGALGLLLEVAMSFLTSACSTDLQSHSTDLHVYSSQSAGDFYRPVTCEDGQLRGCRCPLKLAVFIKGGFLRVVEL